MRTETPQPPPQPAPAKSTAENIKDTLESVVVAFILAFVFRAFIVEAFVIPTGSMATTLYGDQVTNTCSTCGYEYARGIEQKQPPGFIRVRCPNCDTDPDQLRPEQVAAPDSGDRILVFKWPFDTGIKALGPQRWQVTVFKDPADGTTNFIKRLTGLPGEVLEVIDGDVYTAPLEPTKDHQGLNKLAPEVVKELDQLRRDVYEWGHAFNGSQDEARHHYFQDIKPRYDEINKKLLPHLRIHRKLLESPRAQESLWFNVYNNDYLPDYSKLPSRDGASPNSKRVGWYPDGPAAATAWNGGSLGLIGQRELSFASNFKDPLFIRFEGKEITDFSAYNAEYSYRENHLVGDVRVRFTWFPSPADGDGAVVVQMNRDEATFVAEIGVDGSAKVIHKQPGLAGGQQVIGQRSNVFDRGQPLDIQFMQADYLIRLVINGEMVIESNNSQYHPDLNRIMARHRDPTDGLGFRVEPTQVRIGARALKCTLRHVAIDRDEYYRDGQQGESMKYTDPSQTRVKYNPYYLWPGWGTANMPILLRDGHSPDDGKAPTEYFMMGDNSPASKDSRLWWEIGPHLVSRGADYQIGTVPGDQLIGQAFFVYWPAGYRCPSLKQVPFPIIEKLGEVGFIPNVGRMRWIR